MSEPNRVIVFFCQTDTDYQNSITTFDDNLLRILVGNAARVPLLVGNTQNDGTLFAVGEDDLTAFLETFGLTAGVSNITADVVRLIYPGQDDADVIADALRDITFLW